MALEGPNFFDRCIFWSDRCSDVNPCLLHDRWIAEKKKIVGELMEKSNLVELAQKSVR